MSNKINYGFGSGTGDWTGIEDSKTAEPYSSGWWSIYPPYYEFCWHRLPCGDCARTGQPCKHQGNTITTNKYTVNTTTED